MSHQQLIQLIDDDEIIRLLRMLAHMPYLTVRANAPFHVPLVGKSKSWCAAPFPRGETP